MVALREQGLFMFHRRQQKQQGLSLLYRILSWSGLLIANLNNVTIPNGMKHFSVERWDSAGNEYVWKNTWNPILAPVMQHILLTVTNCVGQTLLSTQSSQQYKVTVVLIAIKPEH